MGTSMPNSQQMQYLDETDDEDLSGRHFAYVGARADNNTGRSIPTNARKHI